MTSKFIDNRELLQRISSGEAVSKELISVI
jgi:hypothetical protein